MNQLRPVLIGMPALIEKSQPQKLHACNALDWGAAPKSAGRLQLCTDLQRPRFVVGEDKWSCQLMWAVDQKSSLTFQNYESTRDKEWLG